MMQCPMCRTEKNEWQNVDKFRIKPEGMAICGNCGFISYPERYKTKQEIIDYYKEEYRQPPQVSNIYSGQRKLHYHSVMLSETFDKWKAEGIEAPVITDIGAAFGMLLAWIRDHFPKTDVNGVELTKSFVRNAKHEYGIDLKDDFDDSKKYDLICSYKSLEHIMDPDVELSRYIDSLKDDGVLYISVPIWFNDLCNFGASGFDIEYYYHTNHINVWNQAQFEALVKICGGEIVREDHKLYGSSYIVKRNPEFKTTDRTALKQNINEIKSNLQKVYAAGEAFSLGDTAQAIKIWPNFPIAHRAHYEANRKAMHELGFEGILKELIEPALNACPNEADIHFLAADVAMRYNKFDQALYHLDISNQMRPNMPNTFVQIANCFGAMAEYAKDEKEKILFYKNAREAMVKLKALSLQSFGEATNWILFYNSKIPIEQEA